MNIVWLSWKDRTHPQAGGAETVSGEIMCRLVRDGHKVYHITTRYPGSLSDEIIDGVRTLRVGGRYGVYTKAWKAYKTNELDNWAELVIDEMNTIPFASGFYSKRKNVLLAYQLARKVWFYQMRFPLSLVGYLAEPIYLRLIANRYSKVLTESASTKQDMVMYGFPYNRIHIFRIGMALQPLTSLQPKLSSATVLSLGSVRPMKRTLDAVMAFEHARDKNPAIRMIIAGDAGGPYGNKVRAYARRSRHAEAIDMKGRVTDEERLRLMREAKVILVTSVKEGWGLIITEANSQGTPAIAYDADGLRDSVQNKKTGLVVKNGDTAAMGDAIDQLQTDHTLYAKLQKSAWEWSKEFTFENSYQDFLRIITS